MKKIFFLLLFVHCISSFGQNGEIQIHAKDFHSAQITDILVDPKEEYFITADESGKILMYRTNDFEFHKTISVGGNFPVKKMRLIYGDSILLVSKGYQYNFNSSAAPDSLIAINLNNNAILYKKESSAYFLGDDSDKFLITATQQDSRFLLEVIDKNDLNNRIYTAEFSEKLDRAAISSENKNMAILTGQYFDRKLTIINMAANTVLYEEEIDLHDHSIAHLVYDLEQNLYLFQQDKNQAVMEIYKYDPITFSKQKISSFSFSGGDNIKTEVSRGADLKLFLSSDFNFSPPLILSLKNGNFIQQKIASDKSVSVGAYIKKKDQLVFFEVFNQNLDEITNFFTYNNSTGVFLGNYPNISPGFYQAFFLPDDNWIADGTETINSDGSGWNFAYPGRNIKFFEKGTFNNRFAKLSLQDYLNIYHNIGLTSKFYLDLQSGKMAFYSSKITENYEYDNKYFVYDLLNDSANQFSTVDAVFLIPVEYNDVGKKLLVSNNEYFDTGYYSPREFKIIDPEKSTDIHGTFKYGKLSENGNYLLTVNGENLIEILDLKAKQKVFTHQAEDGKFEIFSADGDAFFVSLANRNIDVNKCNMETIYIVKEQGIYKPTLKDCAFITDFDSKNEKIAMILRNYGIAVNDKILAFSPTEFPESISLNEDGSILMANLSSGKTTLYNTSTVELLGTMIHPSVNSHVFFEPNGNFFGNKDLEEYLYATNNGTPIPLLEASNFYKPAKILELFGEPDTAYLKALKKANELREALTSPPKNSAKRPVITNVFFNNEKNIQVSAHKSVEVTVQIMKNTAIEKFQIELNNVELENLKISSTNKGEYSFKINLVDSLNHLRITAIDKNQVTSFPFEKIIHYKTKDIHPDLYLLAVGVSKYSDENYNLTFADKDALDIAKFYGGISEKDYEKYNERFFGHQYFLKSRDQELQYKKIQLFKGDLYARGIYDLFPANTEGDIWLEFLDDNKLNLWNFQTTTIDAIEVPADYIAPFISKFESIIIDPDGNGFYLKSDNEKVYFFNFRNNSFTDAELPFTSEILENSFPLTNQRWMTYRVAQDYVAFVDTISVEIFNTSGKELEAESFGFNLPNSTEKISAVSHNGQKLLVETMTDSLYYVEVLPGGIMSKKLPIKLGDGFQSQVQFSKDANFFSVLTSTENGKTYKKFDLQGNLVDSIIYNDQDTENPFVSLVNGELRWIEETEPIATNNGLFRTQEDSLLINSKPASFDEVKVKYLVNEEANSQNIQASLKDFFKNVKAEDQVIVFLAGHGVLDEDFNYYYAPHDMDFNNISKNGIKYETILEMMANSSSTKQLLLMDTCHAGNTFDLDENDETASIVPKMGERGSKVVKSADKANYKISDVISTMFDNFSSTNGITILSASSGSDVAYEAKELSNGAFTTAYLSALKNSLKGSDLWVEEEDLKRPIKLTSEIIYAIQKDVITLTNKKQMPDIREINELANIKIW